MYGHHFMTMTRYSTVNALLQQRRGKTDITASSLLKQCVAVRLLQTKLYLDHIRCAHSTLNKTTQITIWHARFHVITKAGEQRIFYLILVRELIHPSPNFIARVSKKEFLNQPISSSAFDCIELLVALGPAHTPNTNQLIQLIKIISMKKLSQVLFKNFHGYGLGSGLVQKYCRPPPLQSRADLLSK